MNIHLKYGRTELPVNVPEKNVTIIEPDFVGGLPDERKAFFDALHHPIGTAPLVEHIRPENTVVIVFCDITRPVPNKRLIPWILEELAFHPKEKITLINATGLHRENTKNELIEMLGEEIVRNYRIVNHTATDSNTLMSLGTNSFGSEISVNSVYYQADVKILTGFIEPHPFAGFSGGPKLVLPGLAGAETIMHNHGTNMIGHPKASWGITYGNPVWEEIHEAATLTKPDFIVNVTLNKNRAITAIFAGDMDRAHAQGTEFARKTAMQPVESPFDIVVTTNAGYPLDLNLYQTCKGIAAARQIVKQDGSILSVSECSGGIPAGSHYQRILKSASSVQELLETINQPGYSHIDQWGAQIQAMIQRWADVYLYSSLPDDDVRACYLEPVSNVEQCVNDLIQKYGPGSSIAVLPEGPQTIPYVKAGGLE